MALVSCTPRPVEDVKAAFYYWSWCCCIIC